MAICAHVPDLPWLIIICFGGPAADEAGPFPFVPENLPFIN
jgi:hypothetical protein